MTPQLLQLRKDTIKLYRIKLRRLGRALSIISFDENIDTAEIDSIVAEIEETKKELELAIAAFDS